MKAARIIILFSLLGLAAACTNDDAAVFGSSGPFTVGYNIKQLAFSWADDPDTDTFRLLENPDGVSGYSQIGSDFPATVTSFDYDIAVHLQDWTNASYILQSCTAGICTDSVPRFPMNSTAAIGYFKASNTGLSDNFGESVAVSGDGNTVAVGARNEDSASDPADNSGAVYVFVREAGEWQAPVYLKASNPGVGDGFGYSVALNGDGTVLAVGSWMEGGTTDLVQGGAVYIFVRNVSGVWSEAAILRASSRNEGDRFGQSVALSDDGNTLVIGAPGEDGDGSGEANNAASDSGAVYTFVRSAGGWVAQDYLKASVIDASAGFGQTVAINGDGTVLAAGAWLEDEGLINDMGAAYVFTYDMEWGIGVRLTATGNAQTSARFGVSVALSPDGTTLAVGAYLEDGTEINSGAAYVFTSDAGSWSEQAIITQAVADFGDQFGISVALSGATGDILAVGASLEDGSSIAVGGDPLLDDATNAGAVYVFTRVGNVWTQHAYLKASNTEAGDRFGTALAMSTDGLTLAVGAGNESSAATGINGDQSNNMENNSGAVYLY